MLNEMEIKRNCEENGYGYKHFYDTAIITTSVDTWRITQMEHGRILVEHANKRNNRKGKMQFHPQRYVQDIDWAFSNIIVPHQNYNRTFQKAFRIKELLKQA